MTSATHRGRLVAAASMILVGAAACGRGTRPVDASLQPDLAAAGKANTATAFTSALELDGSKTAPAPVAQAHAPLKAPHKAVSQTPTRVARAEAAPEAAPSPVIAPPAPTVKAEPVTPAPAPTVEQPAPQPAPLPIPQAQAPPQQPRHGPYKTEAQIFQQMPWIRP